MIIRSFFTTDDLAYLLHPWQSLAKKALVENPFYEPEMLIPALQFLKKSCVKVLTIWTKEAEERLIGLVPLTYEYGYRRIPITVIKLWQHEHCFNTTPLIHRDHSAAAIAALVQCLKNDPLSYLFILNELVADSALLQLLHDTFKANKLYYDHFFSRMRPYLDSSALSSTDFIKRKKLKQLRQKENILRSKGTLRLHVTTEFDEVLNMYQKFLSLEKQGWKGDSGSAICQNPEELSFYDSFIKSRARKEGLIVHALTLNNQTIALRISLKGLKEDAALKIAYNPDFAAFSPGHILEKLYLEDILVKNSNTCIDSCTSQSGTIFEKLWNRERKVSSFAVSKDTFLSKTIVRQRQNLSSLLNSGQKNAG